MTSKTIIGNLTSLLSKGMFSADLGSASYGSSYGKIMEALLAARVSLRDSAEKYISLLNVFSVNPDFLSGRTDFNDIILDSVSSSEGVSEDGILLEQLNNLESWFDSFGVEGSVGDLHGRAIQLSTVNGKCVNLFFNPINSTRYPRGVYSYDSTTFHPLLISNGWSVWSYEVVYDSHGQPIYLGDILSGLMENSALVEALQQLSDTLTMTNVDASTVLGNVNAFLTSKYQSVKDLGPQVISAWKTGGVYGVAMVIVNYFKAMSTAHINDDGDLTFTDNSRLIPQVYISGIVSSIGTTVSSLLTAVLASVSKVAAILVGVVGQIFTAIIGKVNYDYEQETYAALVNTIEVQIPAAPLAMGQDTDQTTMDDYDDDIQAALNPLNCIKVPGGYVLFTATVNGTTYEFHPDLVPRLSSLRSLIGSKCNMSNISLDFSLNDNDITMDQLFNIVGDTDDPAALITDNTDSGVLDASSDERLRGIILVNTFIYLLFCRAYQRATRTLSYSTALDWNFSGGYAVWMGSTLNETETRYFELLAMGVGRVKNNSYGTVKPGTTLESANGWMSTAQTFSIWAQDNTIIRNYQGVPASTSRTLLLTNDFELDYILNNRMFCGPIVPLDSHLSYAVKLPKYDRRSFWTGIAISAIIGTAVAVAAVVVSTVIAKKVREVKLKNTAAVESAYNRVVENPGDTAAMKDYKKAVTKNNLFASIFGGTKYSKSGRWDSTDSTETGQVSEILTAASVETGQTDVANTNSTQDVILLIRGPLSSTPGND